MHEFSLAQGLHDQLLDLARQNLMTRVLRAEVVVGDDAGIVVDSFAFGCGVLAEQSAVTKGMKFQITRDAGSDLILARVELE
jgi:Zn finger protein HypA/HybF involved in hydrogenase expression